MSIHLPPDLEQQLASVASAMRRKPEELAIEALTDYLEDEAAFIASIRLGQAQLDRGEGIPHEQVMETLRKRISLYEQLHAQGDS